MQIFALSVSTLFRTVLDRFCENTVACFDATSHLYESLTANVPKSVGVCALMLCLNEMSVKFLQCVIDPGVVQTFEACCDYLARLVYRVVLSYLCDMRPSSCFRA